MILKQKNGFTIVELLAVVSILVIISGIIVGVIYSTLRGSSKVKVTTEVVQSGQYALSTIKGIVGDSRNITGIDSATVDDGSFVDCTANPSGSSSITFKRIDGHSTKISCGVDVSSGVSTIASNGASLVDVKNVKVNSCSFSCDQLVDDPYSVPIVNVEFVVSDRSGGLFETKSSSSFNLSSSLRTYSP